jgi:predicted transcriptional regulator
MSQSTLEMTKDLVSAQIQSGTLSPEDVQEALDRTHQSLLSLKSREESGLPVSASMADIRRASMDWRQSISKYSITCLECGAHLKQLTGRHLRGHGLDAPAYRTKYGIPRTQSLTTKATAARRRQIMAEVKPWEKTQTYMKAQKDRAATAKRSGRKRAASRQ